MSASTLLLACTILAPSVLAGSNDTCYGSLGCFSNKSPWSDLLRPIPPPQAPEVIDIRFYIHTRAVPDRFPVKHPSDGVWSIEGSDFSGSRQTIFIVHGFCQFSNYSTFNDLTDALLDKVDANIVLVDYGSGACGVLTYLQVISNARVVAASTTQLLKYLIADFGVDVSKVHLIGNSLGAHISGYVAKEFQPKIARITALDAAAPGFEGYDAQVRLDVNDAVFVDAIHTNGRPLVPMLGFGFDDVIGHADFYVNGGWNQPGCGIEKLKPNITSLADFGTATASAIHTFVYCSHERAPELFLAALVVPNCTFWGHKTTSFQRALSTATSGQSPKIWGTTCDKATCSAMGIDAVHYPARGVFDVVTSETAPFCLPDPQADIAMASVYVD